MTIAEDAFETVVPLPTHRPVPASLRRLLAVVLVLDAAVIGSAVVVGWELRMAFDVWSPAHALDNAQLQTAGPWLVVTWLLLLGAQGAYSARNLGVGPVEFRVVALASLITAGMVGMFCYLLQVPLSRGFVLLTFFTGTPSLVLERYAVRKVLHRLRVRGRCVHRVVAVGSEPAVVEVTEVLHRERYVGYQVVAACLPGGPASASAELPVPVLGDVEAVRQTCEEVGADTVLVARGGYDSSTAMRRMVWSLEGAGVDLVMVPSLTDVAGPRISMRPVAGLPLLHVEQPQADEAGGMSKRLFDITLSAVLLAVLSPLMLLVALGVKLHDGGPVFFRQERVGRDGRTFPLLKFRSMVVDAEDRLLQLQALNESDGVLFKMRRDPRITRVGGLLRKYSLDELPQLWNVLRGEMSLVGPRPPLPSEVERYHDDVRRRLVVRPGITGLWQVSGRSELSWRETVRLDLYYVDNWSMLTDLVIMAKTLRAVVRSAGAY